MSGHSHWATIRRKKGAADAKKGQVFTRLAREIVMAAREGGGDPDSNIRLAYAIEKARASNMPKDNIERAIKRGTGELKEGNALEDVIYEGYAQHGVALMITCLTENRNRTVAEIRHILSRSGGSMADAGSVAGVWVNYTPISQSGARLEHGDLVHIGRIGFRFTLRQPGATRKPVVITGPREDSLNDEDATP